MNKTRVRRGIAVGIGFVVGVNVIGLIGRSLAPTPGGPTSSSYSTGADGVAAWSQLLERTDHRVTRLRDPLSEASLAPGSTLVVLDPVGLDREDRSALVDFVHRGGRLVAGGSDAGWTEDLLAGSRWSSLPVSDPVVLAPARETRGVDDVVPTGSGSFTESGPALPVLGRPGRSLVSVARVGDGEMVLLADAGVVQNSGLAEADNAILALGLAGSPARPVVFVESVHGYTAATGLAALPPRWKWALGLALLAALVMIVARGRRIGPPDELSRGLPPPRITYVDSVAGILARSGRPAPADPRSGTQRLASGEKGFGETK